MFQMGQNETKKKAVSESGNWTGHCPAVCVEAKRLKKKVQFRVMFMASGCK